MKPANSKRRLTNRTAADARPGASEYTLWDRSLNHFGLRVYPSGVRSFIVQIRVNGRLRKFTLGRYPATGVAEARTRGAELLARVWAGAQTQVAAVPGRCGPLPPTAAGPLETLLAGDVRHLHEKPPYAPLRAAQARCH